MFAHHARLDAVAHALGAPLAGARHLLSRAHQRPAPVVTPALPAAASPEDALVTQTVSALATRLWIPGASLAFGQALTDTLRRTDATA